MPESRVIVELKEERLTRHLDQVEVLCGGLLYPVAASDSRISDDVHFVNAFGPYYDARDLLLQISSRSQYYEGPEQTL